MTLCECGCGREVKEGNKYIHGHNIKGKKLLPRSKQWIERQSKSHKGQTSGFKGKHHSQKTKDYFHDIKIGVKNIKSSKSKLGKKASEYHKQRIRDTAPKTHSLEHIKKLSGKNHWNYQDGISFLPYCEKFNEIKKEEIRNQYGRKCYICGMEEKDNITKIGKMRKLDVHHVDNDKEQGCNGKPWKLIPLCMHCHAKKKDLNTIKYIVNNVELRNNMSTFIECVNENVKNACEFLHLDDVTTQTLLTPKREVTVHFNVRMDNGEIKRFTGFRVLHNNSIGPGKGGIRFHPDEDINTVRSLSALMTYKTSLSGLPLGGAKGGVICDVKKLSKRELEGISRGYIREIADVIGPEQDIPAPDVYTTPQIMSWMMDEYSIIMRRNIPGVITGKPLVLGGSKGRGNATAMGGMYALREAAKSMGLDLSKSAFAVQGFGNAGMHAAKLAHDMFGMKLVAASDSKGAIVSMRGYDINPIDLERYKKETGSVIGFPHTLTLTRSEELLELAVDILIPSALENVITESNAWLVNAKIIVELANGPTTPAADKVLYERGIHVIPDFLANSGGVIVSHFENVQNRYAHYWSEEEVYKLLDAKITEMYHGVLETSLKNKINMRQAAFVIAINRVVEAMRLRGTI